MNYFYVALIAIIFFSCSNPLENTFNKDSLENDILELKGLLSEDELNQLIEYIGLSVSLGADINNKTYSELLNDIKIAELNEINNSFSRQNIREILKERLENHMCDEFILEMTNKEIDSDNNEGNDKIEWDNDIYFMDY